MSLSENKKVTLTQMWQMYINDELRDFVSLDHVVLAKKKSNNDPVWVRVEM